MSPQKRRQTESRVARAEKILDKYDHRAWPLERTSLDQDLDSLIQRLNKY
jgi:hypothetical protein